MMQSIYYLYYILLCDMDCLVKYKKYKNSPYMRVIVVYVCWCPAAARHSHSLCASIFQHNSLYLGQTFKNWPKPRATLAT